MIDALKQYRRLRDEAGVLLSYVVDAGNTREAWRIYHEWRDGKLTYREALKKLRRLVENASH